MEKMWIFEFHENKTVKSFITPQALKWIHTSSLLAKKWKNISSNICLRGAFFLKGLCQWRTKGYDTSIILFSSWTNLIPGIKSLAFMMARSLSSIMVTQDILLMNFDLDQTDIYQCKLWLLNENGLDSTICMWMFVQTS